jgi:hypothetical protein
MFVFSLFIRDWVIMRGVPPVDISGLFLKALATGMTDIDQSFGDAAVRALNEAEAARYLSDPSHPPRVFLPPTFVVSMLMICYSVDTKNTLHTA